LIGCCLVASSCAKEKVQFERTEKRPVRQNTVNVQEIIFNTQTAQNAVSAHTSGAISREGKILVHFAHEIVDSSRLDMPLENSPILFQPDIKGTAVWTTSRTLEFRPDDRLPAGQDYAAILSLSKIMETSEPSEEFRFQFSTMKQSFEITIDGLQTIDQNDLKSQKLSGRIIIADKEDETNIEKMLEARQAGKGLKIGWMHDKEGLEHAFMIGDILRGDSQSSVIVRWDGNPIGVDKKGETLIPVPPVSLFEVDQVRAIQGDEKYIEIRFTDPLKKRQDLQGLIRVSDCPNLRYNIEQNIVRVYSSSKWPDKATVKVEPGIHNIMGYPLKEGKEFTVEFAERKPQVRFCGKGVILPTTRGLTIPIETVNLRAVVVEAMCIYENNMAQFLQDNTLEGSENLRQVGRVVWKKTVPLGWTADKKDQWVRYGLDVSPLLQENHNGFFRIRLSFKQHHIVYECPGSPANTMDEDEITELDKPDEEEETSYWDSYESDQGYYEDYHNRENPCHPAYYKKYGDHDIGVERNVLISDIGLMAKRGSDDTIFVVATDIKTAQPLPDTRITLLDYQQQEIASGKTDGQGMVMLTAARTPFLVIAQKDEQGGYLKLEDGSALSVSHFDVSGETVEKGLKGFIYGERGVWRPGDPIYLTFILMDIHNQLPEDHPVRFELHNPKGQLVKTVIQKGSVNGFYTFRTGTDPDAPTGNWMARIKAGGATFEKILRIETVMPNRLKIAFDFGPETKSLSEGKIRTELSATWLHGAIAKNLKADVNLTFTPRKTCFNRYMEYIFDDPTRDYSPESHTIFEGETDNQGKAIVEADIRAANVSPGMLTANFKTRVFEPGGAFSVDQFSIPYHPYERYVGILLPKGDKARGMLLTDVDHTARIAVLGSNGEPVPSAKIEVKMYKIQWRWWWEKGEESLASYIGSSNYQPIMQDTVQIKDGEGEWKFQIKYPSWGRYLIRVADMNGKHSTGKVVYIDWPGWAGRPQKDEPGGAKVLNFSSDKDEYQVGENVMLTIPTGKQGRGLVSIESGSRVIKTAWITAGEEPARFQFPVTHDMIPNVYVHVTFLQPHLQAGNDLPIRMYGVIPIKVVAPDTILEPQISSSDVFIPEETAKVRVSEANGRAMTYTIAVVDEGLLDLTRFETPNPWNHFYKREALGVKTWDLFDLVVGAYGGRLEQLLAIGGDGEAEPEGHKKAQRFPPMVCFMGPFELKKGAENSHDIDIPQYVGSVRVMVVAGQGKAFGCAQRQVYVRKPIMILGTLPRVLGPEEEVELPVSVFVMDPKIKDVSITVKTEGPISVVGPDQKNITFSGTGDQMVTFRVKVGSQVGIAKGYLQAAGGGEKAGHMIELDIRMPGVPVVDVVDTVIPREGKWSQRVDLPGVPGTNEALLEVSRIPPLNLGKRLEFLIRYPHGCIEQTTSSVFPQLYLDRLLDLPQKKQDEIERNIKAGINRLKSFQTTEGGFSYWPGDGQAQDWASNYAGHFMVEAEMAGYLVPPGMLEQWKAYQSKNTRSWVAGTERSELIQTYRIYTLALSNAFEMGAMNRLKEMKDLSTAARWQLAASYQLAGQPEAAAALLRGKKMSFSPYRELSHTYGSDLRDKAMVLEALCLMDEIRNAMPLAKEISEELSGEKWLSTQTTAYALIAMARYTGIEGGAGRMDFTLSWNQGDPLAVSTDSPMIQESLVVDDKTFGLIEIENKGDMALYARIILKGLPPIGSEMAAENGMKIKAEYLTLEGEPIDPDKLEQGTDFVAEVQIFHTGRSMDYEEVVLSQIFPSGWEIHNARMYSSALEDEGEFEYQDIRDDRIYTYFDIKQNKSKIFRVQLNASYLGRFYLPMVAVEAMYDATINARVPGHWVEVVRPGE